MLGVLMMLCLMFAVDEAVDAGDAVNAVVARVPTKLPSPQVPVLPVL